MKRMLNNLLISIILQWTAIGSLTAENITTERAEPQDAYISMKNNVYPESLFNANQIKTTYVSDFVKFKKDLASANNRIDNLTEKILQRASDMRAKGMLKDTNGNRSKRDGLTAEERELIIDLQYKRGRYPVNRNDLTKGFKFYKDPTKVSRKIINVYSCYEEVSTSIKWIDKNVIKSEGLHADTHYATKNNLLTFIIYDKNALLKGNAGSAMLLRLGKSNVFIEQTPFGNIKMWTILKVKGAHVYITSSIVYDIIGNYYGTMVAYKCT